MNSVEWELMDGRQRTLWLEAHSKASKRSLTQRGLVYGVGTNDATYHVRTKISFQASCPAYKTWQGMIERCYSERSIAKCPSYKGVTVCPEWHLFSVFREWWIENNVDGYQIDKDLLVPGNKIYSPLTCVYVPQHINCLLTDRRAARGRFPIGVVKHESFKTKPYEARVNINGKTKGLGSFDDPFDAHMAYQTAKLAYIDELKKELDSIDSRLYQSIRYQVMSKSDASKECLV